mgnify:CR=1 FL=1
MLTQGELDYLEGHLRILSGFYGLLATPFDGVVAYRLEMGAKLSVSGKKDLYAYWGDTLAQALWEESDIVVNLASQEYSRCIAAHPKPGTRLITCIFGEVRQGKVVEKGTLCKMAQGGDGPLPGPAGRGRAGGYAIPVPLGLPVPAGPVR